MSPGKIKGNSKNSSLALSEAFKDGLRYTLNFCPSFLKSYL